MVTSHIPAADEHDQSDEDAGFSGHHQPDQKRGFIEPPYSPSIK